MTSTDKKLAVLHQLSQNADPVSLPDLLDRLGSDFVERSVRRWLAEMVTEGLVEQSGHKRGTKYRVISRANRKINHDANRDPHSAPPAHKVLWDRPNFRHLA